MNEKEKAKAIGLRLKLKRIELGLSQYDLAEKIGVHNSDISQYELGHVIRIPTEVLSKICNVLGLTLEGVDPDRFGSGKPYKGDL